MEFIEYDLFSPALCLGERMKGALFRPCLKLAIPYSQITGALRRKFGGEIHAAGYFIPGNGYNRVQQLVYSPRDRVQGISRLPLQAEFLADARGKIFVVKNDDATSLPTEFEIFMGALISKGLGLCKLRRSRIIGKVHLTRGLLQTRLPCSEVQLFGVRNVIAPVYGYLFKPSSLIAGAYVLSIFEGSDVVAPECLVSPLGRR